MTRPIFALLLLALVAGCGDASLRYNQQLHNEYMRISANRSIAFQHHMLAIEARDIERMEHWNRECAIYDIAQAMIEADKYAQKRDVVGGPDFDYVAAARAQVESQEESSQ